MSVECEILEKSHITLKERVKPNVRAMCNDSKLKTFMMLT